MHRLSMTHLYDPVLGRPAPLPLEHGVDVGGLRHGDRLGVRRQLRRQVPLLGVLVQLEVVQPLERRVRAQDHLGATLLRGKRRKKEFF